MLTARPRPSSSNQFEKRQSQWDYDKAARAIFPVDFPEFASSPPRALLTKSTTKLVFLKPKRMTVNVLYSRENVHRAGSAYLHRRYVLKSLSHPVMRNQHADARHHFGKVTLPTVLYLPCWCRNHTACPLGFLRHSDNWSGNSSNANICHCQPTCTEKRGPPRPHTQHPAAQTSALLQ